MDNAKSYEAAQSPEEPDVDGNVEEVSAPESSTEIDAVGEAAAIDDGLREVPEEDSGILQAAAKVAPAFVLTRMDTLIKPALKEELSEPDSGAGDACSCNSVCSCVPVETCACNQVCTCDTVDSCPSYESTCYGGGGGYGGYYAPCH